MILLNERGFVRMYNYRWNKCKFSVRIFQPGVTPLTKETRRNRYRLRWPLEDFRRLKPSFLFHKSYAQFNHPPILREWRSWKLQSWEYQAYLSLDGKWMLEQMNARGRERKYSYPVGNKTNCRLSRVPSSRKSGLFYQQERLVAVAENRGWHIESNGARALHWEPSKRPLQSLVEAGRLTPYIRYSK